MTPTYISVPMAMTLVTSPTELLLTVRKSAYANPAKGHEVSLDLVASHTRGIFKVIDEPVDAGEGWTLRLREIIDNALIEGHYYWAQPTLDPDSPEILWANDVQPARYGGVDKDGKHIWYWIGLSALEGDLTWPTRFVGKEILP